MIKKIKKEIKSVIEATLTFDKIFFFRNARDIIDKPRQSAVRDAAERSQREMRLRHLHWITLTVVHL